MGDVKRHPGPFPGARTDRLLDAASQVARPREVSPDRAGPGRESAPCGDHLSSRTCGPGLRPGAQRSALYMRLESPEVWEAWLWAAGLTWVKSPQAGGGICGGQLPAVASFTFSDLLSREPPSGRRTIVLRNHQSVSGERTPATHPPLRQTLGAWSQAMLSEAQPIF